MKERPHLWPCLLTALLLLSAIGHLPLSFYRFVHVVATIGSGYLAILSFSSERPLIGCAAAVVGVFFNPIVPMHFDRATWQMLDGGGGLVLAIASGGRMKAHP